MCLCFEACCAMIMFPKPFTDMQTKEEIRQNKQNHFKTSHMNDFVLFRKLKEHGNN